MTKNESPRPDEASVPPGQDAEDATLEDETLDDVAGGTIRGPEQSPPIAL